MVYASVLAPFQASLNEAVRALLVSIEPEATVLWSMHYIQHHAAQGKAFSPMSGAVALEDSIIDEVKDAWRTIVGEDADEAGFMRFAPRNQEEEEGVME